MASGNPALTQKTFVNAPAATGARMTINGTVHKTAVLLLLTVVTAFFTWRSALSMLYTSSTYDPMAVFGPWVLGSAIVAFMVALVVIFKKTWAPYLAPVYAILEGVVIGFVSMTMEIQFPGIALQAAGLTFGTLAGMLMAYRSGLIRATENFKLGVVAATGGIVVVYLADLVMRMFGMPIGFIHDNGWLGIGFSLLVVGIAALNLVLDFDFIETGVERGAPAYMEWYGAFGLLVTLIWLYLEILRLLSKVRSR
ncbi:Bax inhibitor-1/YccA family protein [Salinisphaera sp. Q1T1-3]|uniref:Bax inhibitor-1/YccA family protein n=1 Tax=Salinisphaera sp. Q1T1-3 TaxID=2321229 RepID=UPI000E758D21|nr:Bax inhibitor-1/YccA family protein [Salinisphaera sp. Q1T1-3]RJS91786.1 Bax inhibitor-1/YccA family protein [Salinisphaera sp. Q1T1-3]